MLASALKFKTITVATDLGETASSALRYAQAIARLHHSTLVIVHVVDPLGYAFPEGAPASLQASPGAREELARIEEETRLQGIPVHSIMETGMVHERILQALKDDRSDLLVLGTRGKTEAGRAAMGKIARQLLAGSPCPILTVPAGADAYLASAGRWRNVLAAIDFSPVSVAALSCGHQMANKRFIVLHVPRCFSEDECSKCLERLRFLAPLNESHTVPVEHLVKSGEASKLIAEYASKCRADLIVLGAPSNALAEEDLPASTVLQAISKAACPVLCIPIPRSVSPLTLIREVAFAR
jgi:nucleotide-binding universal stress UspA family protein